MLVKGHVLVIQGIQNQIQNSLNNIKKGREKAM